MRIEKLLNEEVQAFIRSHENDDPHELMLQARKWPGLPIKDIVSQIQSRQKARTKLPEWFGTAGIVFPQAKYLEQASSEATARYKSIWTNGSRFLDLTGGTGVDSYYFSRFFDQAVFVEPNRELIELARHNFQCLKVNNVTFVNALAEDFLETGPGSFDLIYIDPSRRPSGKKVFRLEDCLPDIIKLLPRLRNLAPKTVLKASPILDINLAIKTLKPVIKVRVISVNNDCKELLFEIGEGDNLHVCAINLKGEGDIQQTEFNLAEEATIKVKFSLPMQYLYEPNASILKAGAFKSTAKKYGLSKLHPGSHLYTANDLKSEFPGRVFKIESWEPFGWKDLLSFKGRKANLAVRNFPHPVAEIRKKSGIKEGGDKYFFFSTAGSRQLVTIRCRRLRG